MKEKMEDYLIGLLVGSVITAFLLVTMVLVWASSLKETRQTFPQLIKRITKKSGQIKTLDFVNADLELGGQVYIRAEGIVMEEVERNMFRVLVNGHEMKLPGIMLCKQERNNGKTRENPRNHKR